MNRTTTTWERLKTVSGVVVTATAVLAMLAGGNVARGDSVTRGIQVEYDDGEEYLNTLYPPNDPTYPDCTQGRGWLDSSDLELGVEDEALGWQVIAMQYDQLGIPQGATINSAKITFQVDNSGNPGTSNDFTILAEAADNASLFGYSLDAPNWPGWAWLASYDITDRDRTVAGVSWAPAAAPAAGTKMDTPDISPLIQEVVDRAGWSENNRLTLMIYPDVYLDLPDPSTGGTTTVQEIEFEAGPGADSATLTVDFTPGLSGPIPGDANDNGFVDDIDLAIVLGNWEQDALVISTWALGNFTEGSLGDTDVEDADLAVLLGNWTGGPPPGGAAVPEPATIALLTLGALTLARRRRQ